MKKFAKKLSALLLTLAMVLTLAPAVQASAALSVPSSQTVYLSGTGTGSASETIYISGLSKSQKITKASVKSSNTKVAAVRYLSHSSSVYSYSSVYYDGTKDNKSSSNSYSANIGLNLKKAGTTTVSFKIGSKTYKSKVVVKKYVNPLKSLTITGINGGKNLAGAFKSGNHASGKLTKTAKNVWVKATAASGWKIRSLSLTDSKTWNDHSFGGYSNPVSSAVVGVGTLTGGKAYYAHVSLVNTSNQGTIYLNYQIN